MIEYVLSKKYCLIKIAKKTFRTTFVGEIITVFDILRICIELYNFYGFEVNL